MLFTSKSEINAFEMLSMVIIASYEVAPIVMTSLYTQNPPTEVDGLTVMGSSNDNVLPDAVMV